MDIEAAHVLPQREEDVYFSQTYPLALPQCLTEGRTSINSGWRDGDLKLSNQSCPTAFLTPIRIFLLYSDALHSKNVTTSTKKHSPEIQAPLHQFLHGLSFLDAVKSIPASTFPATTSSALVASQKMTLNSQLVLWPQPTQFNMLPFSSQTC